jgi:hypothetical protein
MNKITGLLGITWQETQLIAQREISKKLGFKVTVDDAADVIVDYNKPTERVIGYIETKFINWEYKEYK